MAHVHTIDDSSHKNHTKVKSANSPAQAKTVLEIAEFKDDRVYKVVEVSFTSAPSK